MPRRRRAGAKDLARQAASDGDDDFSRQRQPRGDAAGGSTARGMDGGGTTETRRRRRPKGAVGTDIRNGGATRTPPCTPIDTYAYGSPPPPPLCFDDRTTGYLLLTLTATLAYAPVFYSGYVWDDYILQEFCSSAMGTTWRGLYDLWFRPSTFEAEPHYWPVTYTSFWIENNYLWGDDNPAGYHAVNLVLHILNSCLVHGLMRKVGSSDEAAWLAAAIFALHPTRVESVAWILERKDVLSGLFYLGALLRHPNVYSGVSGRSRRGQGQCWRLIQSLVLYILAMLSKSIVVSLPAILLLHPWMTRGRITSSELRHSLPFFVTGVLLALFDVHSTREKDGAINFGGLTLVVRVGIACRAICSYLWRLLWPVGLMPVYPRWNPNEDAVVWAGSFLAVMAASVASLRVLVTAMHPSEGSKEPAQRGQGRWSLQLTRRRQRILVGTFVYFGATLFPVLCLIDYGYMLYSYTADRFAYLAAIGPFALFAVAATSRSRGRSGGGGRRNTTAAAAGKVKWAIPLLTILGTLTYNYSSVYVTEVTFYEHATALNPAARKMWTNLGHAYSRAERHSEAVDCYQKSLQLDTDIINKPYRSLGVALQKSGRLAEAAEPMKKAVELARDDSAKGGILEELGDLYMQLDRNAEAAESYAESMTRDTSKFDAYANYGIVLRKLGRTQEAIEMLKKGLETLSMRNNPSGRKKTLNELGNTVSSLKRYDDAVLYFRQALEIDPTYAIGWNNLANDLYRAGKGEEAVEAFRKAFEIDPNYNRARFNCALVLGRLGRIEEQVDLLRLVLEREPGHENAKELLDAALAKVS